MAVLVTVLCTGTSLLCALLLWRGYRQSRARLLFWSAVCFGFMAVGNALLIVDVNVWPHWDLAPWRTGAHLAGVASLLCGLVWDTD